MTIRILMILTFIAIALPVGAYEKIIEFDTNDDIIITTSVYNSTGKPCFNCTCNFTLYNVAPDENTVFASAIMENKNNGIYVYNLSDNIAVPFSSKVYPMSIFCNDSASKFGGDNRDGIKVSETLYDYTSAMLAVIGVAIGLLVMSFKMDKQYEYIKRLTFFSSFAFMISSIALGYVILNQSPAPDDFIIIMSITAIVLIMVIFGVLYLYFLERLKAPITQIGQGRHT